MLAMHNLVSQGYIHHVLQALQHWTGAQEVGGHLQAVQHSEAKQAGQPQSELSAASRASD